MMRFIPLVLLILTCFTHELLAQESERAFAQKDSKQVINEIIFEGNYKTKRSYLLTHLNLKVGDAYREAEIELKVQLLASLSGLYKTEYHLEKLHTDSTRSILVVNVYEQRTLLPVIDFGRVEWYGWFQLGLVDINLGGRGNEIYAYYQNNQGRHAGQIIYKMPRVLGSKFGFSLNGLIWRSIEPLNFDESRQFYDYDNRLLGGDLLYHIAPRNVLLAGFYAFNEVYALHDNIPFHAGPSSLNLNKKLYKVEHNIQQLRYDDLRIDGFELTTNYQYVSTRETDEDFHIVSMELKAFKSVKVRPNKSSHTTILASRAKIGLSTNNDSPFAPFYVDSYNNVRGIGDRVARGTGLISLNTELRQLILSRSFFTAEVVAFTDAVALRFPGQLATEVSFENNFDVFAGLGTRLRYRKIFNAVLRIDYGINFQNLSEGQFVLGLGQFF